MTCLNVMSFGPTEAIDTWQRATFGVPGTVDFPVPDPVKTFSIDINRAQFELANLRVNTMRLLTPRYTLLTNTTCANRVDYVLGDLLLGLGLPDGQSPIRVPSSIAAISDSVGYTTNAVTNIDLVNPYALHEDLVNEGYAEVAFDPVTEGLVDPSTREIQTGIRDPGLGPNNNPTAISETLDFSPNFFFRSKDIDVLANDTDPDGETISVSSVDPMSNNGGLVTLLPNGEIRYTPPPPTGTPPVDFTGTDTFNYTITDPWSGTSTATVTVEVK